MQPTRFAVCSRGARVCLLSVAFGATSWSHAQSLVNYYSFDAGAITTSGSVILTASGIGSTLANRETPVVDASGRFGGAANFSAGRLDTPAFGDGTTTALGNNFSVSFWMKTSDVTATSQSYVFQTGGAVSPQNAVIFGYSSGLMEFFGESAFTGSNPRPSSGITLGASLNNQWFNVVYTYDGATFKGYLNGHEEFSTATTFSLTSAGGLSIGGSRNGVSFSNHLTGSLDDFAIFQGALSARQVTALQSAPAISLVPEPSEYAMVAGVALLGFGVLRRRAASTV
ncbi:MAG TPA: LamG-like jellyroll fold domain-containing protein [Verrucomicrobiae bacterium]|nr:LamG-like jellyroll fold domain-containing protein [Verrucomicrobiae bacterium]